MLRVITLFSILFASIVSSVASAEEISGMFVRDSGTNFIVSTELKRRVQILTVNPESAQAISQLNTTDLIYGSGELDGDVFLLNSVDLVGLRNLLGVWKSTHTQLDFVSFSYVQVRRNKQKMSTTTPKQTLQYVITPGPEANGWRIFFSDEKSVSLASLSLVGRRAYFEFYDENTGEIIDQIVLKKQ